MEGTCCPRCFWPVGHDSPCQVAQFPVRYRCHFDSCPRSNRGSQTRPSLSPSSAWPRPPPRSRHSKSRPSAFSPPSACSAWPRPPEPSLTWPCPPHSSSPWWCELWLWLGRLPTRAGRASWARGRPWPARLTGSRTTQSLAQSSTEACELQATRTSLGANGRGPRVWQLISSVDGCLSRGTSPRLRLL